MGVSVAAVIVGSASAALATPASAPSVHQSEYETLQPVLHATSTDPGTGGHTLHFFARTIGSATWNLLNDVPVGGTDAFQALPPGALAMGQGFDYQVSDCDSSGCATSNIIRGHVSPDLAAGTRAGATQLPFTIGDKIAASVDVGTGNLLVTTTEISLPQVIGSLDLGMVYNSLTLAPGSQFGSSAGPGWRFSTGRDIHLDPNDDGSVGYFGPSGVTAMFTPVPGSTTTFTSPSTVKATLVQNATGGYDLTMHDSGDVYHFSHGGALVHLTDRNGNDSSFVYGTGARGPLTKVQSDRGTQSARVVTVTSDATTNDILGLSQAPTGATPRTVTYGYDTNGRLATITDVLGRATTFGYTTGGDLASIIAPGGAETDFTYDVAHRVTAVTQPSAATAQAITRLVYNTGQTLVAAPNTDQAQAVAVVAHTSYDLTVDGLLLVSQATDPSGYAVSTTYTGHADVATQTDSHGTSSYTYDPAVNGGESLTGTTDPTGASSSVSYTAASAPYDPSAVADAQGNTTGYSYDASGNQITTTDETNASSSVTYNADGTVATSTTALGATTTYTYGAYNQQLQRITPPAGSGLGVQTFTYDPFGRVATAVSGRGVTRITSYDAADRITEVDYSDGTPSVSYTYNPAGQLATRTDASGTTTFTYDPLGRLTSRTHSAGGGTLSYRYDLDGNLTSETDGNGTTTHAYDTRDLLTATTTPDGRTIGYGYTADGTRTDSWFATNTGNTSWAAHNHTDYDNSGRISRMWTGRASSDATRVSDLSYSYASPGTANCATAPPVGQDTDLRWTVTDNLAGATTSYCYDHANRLTGATTTGGDTWAYSYDADGNRLQTTKNGTVIQNVTANSADQLTGGAYPGYHYDADGNLTSAPNSVQLTYNGADQLTNRTGGATGSYTYAGTDQTELISQATPGNGSYSYAYGRTDDNGQPILDTVTNSNGTSYLTHDPSGTPLALKTWQGSYSYYALDALGSPVALINTSGTVIATYTYDPWGNATVGNPTNSTAASLNPYRFAGGLNDRTTGWVKYGVRYYNAGEGRWTQQDALAAPLAATVANRYSYAAGDPVGLTDANGHMPGAVCAGRTTSQCRSVIQRTQLKRGLCFWGGVILWVLPVTDVFRAAWTGVKIIKTSTRIAGWASGASAFQISVCS